MLIARLRRLRARKEDSHEANCFSAGAGSRAGCRAHSCSKWRTSELDGKFRRRRKPLTHLQRVSSRFLPRPIHETEFGAPIRYIVSGHQCRGRRRLLLSSHSGSKWCREHTLKPGNWGGASFGESTEHLPTSRRTHRVDSMSNRSTKEAGANIVGSIASFIVAPKPKGPSSTLHSGKCNVENLVENGGEMGAQATEENCWCLSPPREFSPHVTDYRMFTEIYPSMRCGDLATTRSRNNLHRNVAISNVKVY